MSKLNINDVVTWLLASGLFTWAYFGLLSPMLHQWVATQKASKGRQVEELLLNLADTAVQGLATNYNMTGATKKSAAVQRVNKALADKGINVDDQRVQDTVERAYQAFAQTDAPAIKQQAKLQQQPQTGGPVKPQDKGAK
ncbi:phage holin, LLH family [Furfurilactobacillus sp. WILCCON 0119]